MKRFLLSMFLVGLATAPDTARPQESVPVAGEDYVVIENGHPLDAVEGKIVVEEFFNYACPACNRFEPMLLTWLRDLPDDVQLMHIPASFRPDFVPYARAYYTAEMKGLIDKTHGAVYLAIHSTHQLPGEGEEPDEERIAAFYANYGVDASNFLRSMRGFGVDSKVRRATEYMKRVGITGTPSLVVNGRYLVRAASMGDMLRIASYLIEQERKS